MSSIEYKEMKAYQRKKRIDDTYIIIGIHINYQNTYIIHAHSRSLSSSVGFLG